MTDYSRLVIEALNARHDRAGFQCGVRSLDDYIHRQARQDEKRRISRVFIATEFDRPKDIAGFYTLSAISIELSHLPPNLSGKLPRHPIPAALIGRLAVARGAQGNGIGKILMADAIERTLAVSNDIAIYSIVVDAIDERAQEFYRQFGFVPLTSENRRLFLALKSI